MPFDQDRKIARTFEQEGPRLRGFIRRRVADARDAEDILQDVFAELVQANQLLMPIEHLTGWLFRVARNRITDLLRKKTTHGCEDEGPRGEREETLDLAELLPSADAGPDALYARRRLLDQLEAALGELPAEQRWVFIAHEIEGRSFKEMAAETGIGINTLLARKRYALLHLRERLQGARAELSST